LPDKTRGEVAVAEVARPHGIRGELRVHVYNESSDVLLKKPPVTLVLADGSERPAKIVGARRANKAVLIELAGLVDRNAAELLRGAKLLVAREELSPLEEGEFYVCDLAGAKVLLAGVEIGRVKSIQAYPTCDALVVEREAKATLEVPLVDAYVASVDAAAGVVELVTIEGLS
jgi:16S rRNA processing protein RimM